MGLFKDRFAAEMIGRLGIAGRVLGLPAELVEAIGIVETAIRPVLSRIAEIAGKDGETTRLAGLNGTLEGQLARIDLGPGEFEGWPEATVDVEAVMSKLLSRAWQGERVAPDRIGRLRAVAR